MATRRSPRLTQMMTSTMSEEPVPRNQQTRADAEAERVEHNRAADLAVAQDIPERRPSRSAATAANKAMDALNQRGELV